MGEGGDDLLMEALRVVRGVAASVREKHRAACVVTNEGAYQESKHMHWRVLFRGSLPDALA